jgi:hypothetical protein
MNRERVLQIVLRLVGLTFIFGIYTLTVVWPSGWSWHTGHLPHYMQMILGVYATLGIFLLMASAAPQSIAALSPLPPSRALFTPASWECRH